MPNWCEGKMKVRGELDDILTFLRDGFEGSYSDSMITIDDKYDDEIEINVIRTNYIKGTERAFVDDSQTYIYPYRKGSDVQKPIIVLTLNMRQAWNIHSSEFLNIAKNYNLDMHLIGFQSGAEFKREVYIINGEITEDKTIDYVDWDFECEGSELGG